MVSANDAYLYALRVAFLSYQLGPRARRMQHVPVPRPLGHRSATSVNDLMKDFSLVRDTKSTRFPSRFMTVLEKRLGIVMVGRERSPEYHDAAVKRSFGAAYNAFTEPGFKKRMEKDRRVEDLVLIFLSNATKELAKGKAPSDPSIKSMGDRHLALFVRLMNSILRDEDWAKERPELASRLATLESKLLKNDQDLSAGSAASGADTMVEVLAPLSNEVKDMPLVQVVARTFGLTNTMAQSDIDKHKSEWTVKAALQDVKTYQTLLNLNSPQTLRSSDFDFEEAYEAWKKGEAPDLSQMILTMVQASPELAKSTSVNNNAQSNLVPHPTDNSGAAYFDASRKMLGGQDRSSYALDQPADMTPIYNAFVENSQAENHAFIFIPDDPRAYYRAVLSQAMDHDLQDQNFRPPGTTSGASAQRLLSKQSVDLLNELSFRWRIPFVSKHILFLDVVREKFLNSDLVLEDLDVAFDLVKNPPQENKKDMDMLNSILQDRTKWPLADITSIQHILSLLHDALLRDLLSVTLQTYEPKPPSPGMILLVLETHIESDPSFAKSAARESQFTNELEKGLREQAFNVYKEYTSKQLPENQEEWDFLHVINLGKDVTSLVQRIQKRYRKNPQILGVSPMTCLVAVVLPLYAEDSREIIARILQLARNREEEIPVDDGFELYKELVEIRRIHKEALPNVEFTFKIEDQLADFVWRWIKITDDSINTWVDGAVRQDQFKVRCGPDEYPTEEQRHSVSAIDSFSSFNQTISKVKELDWDNELHTAKFMTALSKSVGNGIARYCDLLQEKFSKEMDRLTPEQETATKRTRQEKWMQMAKDLYNNQEKIEPFNFFPEVSVYNLSLDITNQYAVFC